MIELREQDGERIVELARLWYRSLLTNLKEYRRKQYHHCLGFRSNAIIHNVPRVVETYPITEHVNPTRRMRTYNSCSSVNVLC